MNHEVRLVWPALCCALVLLVGCPGDGDTGFAIGDDDDDDDDDSAEVIPGSISEGLCHLKGAFFRMDSAVGTLTQVSPGQGVEEISCDFDADGNDETYYVQWDEHQWLNEGGGQPDPYPRQHSPVQSADTYLNGGTEGVKFVIYVGGINTDEPQAFLWISYHNTPTYLGDTDEDTSTVEMCNPIWSFNIDDEYIEAGLTRPVVGTLSDYASSLGSGHDTRPSDFGFFPLGVFDISSNADYSEITFQADEVTDSGWGADYQYVLLVDGGTTVGSLDYCNVNPASAFTEMELEQFQIQNETFFGEDTHAGYSDDSLAGIDWNPAVLGNDSTETWSYVSRTSPTSFVDDIEDVQSGTTYGFESNCSCP